MKKILLLSMLLSTSSVFADNNFKLGYVDVGKIFATSKPALAAKQALKAKFMPEQKDLQAGNQQLMNEQAQMQALMKTAPSLDKMTPSNRTKLEALNQKFQKDQANFQRKYMAFQQHLQRSQDFASAKVLAVANTILKDISDKGGYDLVVTSNQLVYAKPKYDLTDQVILQLNQMDTNKLVKQLDNIENQSLNTNPRLNPGVSAVGTGA